MEKTFEVLINPLQKYFEEHSARIDKLSDSRKFKFVDFTHTMIFAYLMQIPSLRKLSDKTFLNDSAKNLGIKHFAWTTIRDGFTRFSSGFFMDMYRHILKNTQLIRLERVDELGLISLVDGSIFPTIINMCWAVYKQHKRAIRLHVEFSLNQMIPLEFIGQKANSSERKFLLSIVSQGVTYVADRGYFSFEVVTSITKAFAFFIFRIKNNMQYEVGKILTVSGEIPPCLKNVTDELIRFTNDPNETVYRIIRFKVLQSEFIICTNRLCLTTLQIIMLYAYRWQIELLFKFIKRVLKGIHLFNHSENGANIQFCLLMIMAVLYLRMRQFCKITAQTVKFSEKTEVTDRPSIEDFNNSKEKSPEIWYNVINKVFQQFWKISSYWIENLKDIIDKPFDYQAVMILAR